MKRILIGFSLNLLVMGAPRPTLPAPTVAGPGELQLFRPAMDSKGLLSIDVSQVLGHLDPSFGLVVSWASRPLSLVSELPASAGVRSLYEVNNLVTGHLQAAVGLWSTLQLGLSLPLSLWHGQRLPAADLEDDRGISAQGLGDLALQVKWRLMSSSRHVIGLAAKGAVELPTGDAGALLSTGLLTVAPRLILDKELWRGKLTLVANAGLRLRSGSARWEDTRTCQLDGVPHACGTGRDNEVSNLLTYGVGGTLQLVSGRLDVLAELTGQTRLAGLSEGERLNSAGEVLAGLKLYLAQSSYFTLAAGRGLRDGGNNFPIGSSDFRLIGAFVFEPAIGDRDGDGIKDDVDRCPDDPEDFDGFEDEDGCPDPDNDRDGIPDADDLCPDEPEDFDGFEDEDGCPEVEALDRDGDGIPDQLDKCPDEPEDFDGFEDEDGCPDLDNDRDGILDADDLCPNEPEDFDGFEDEDGCPDLDNDRDGILDVDDRCPNDPETYNGFEDEDGCPDRRPFTVSRGSIDIMRPIHFETDSAVIKPVSFSLLDAIAAFLKGDQDILLVEIQGHADERGSAGYNLELTGRRADAVKHYLVRQGVSAERLQARGYGESRPKDRRRTPAAWAVNRRVDFLIRQRSQQ